GTSIKTVNKPPSQAGGASENAHKKIDLQKRYIYHNTVNIASSRKTSQQFQLFYSETLFVSFNIFVLMVSYTLKQKESRGKVGFCR
ncbi:MAG: hypothetical protein RSD23_06920, partial [Ruthenibacterium sp.]